MIQDLKNNDGGYYAIKGFSFQFDKSIIEALDNPNSDVLIEQVEDIEVNNFIIQSKYKETQNYSPSKIQKPVTQLLRIFRENKKTGFCLYCYFKDKNLSQDSVDLKDLDEILGKSKNEFSKRDKSAFLKHFKINFSEDYTSQFDSLIKKIKTSFDLKTDEEAVLFHAFIRSRLIDIAIHKNKSSRIINFAILKSYAKKSGQVLFDYEYEKYLGTKKYLEFLRKEFFVYKNPNIPGVERLFIIQIDNDIKDTGLVSILFNIQKRYFKRDTSPAPYICLLGIEPSRLKSLKSDLWDSKLYFSDGTHFDGDKFRIIDLVEPTYNKNSFVKFKIVNIENIPDLLRNIDVKQLNIFLTSPQDLKKIDFLESNIFYVSETKNIIKIITP